MSHETYVFNCLLIVTVVLAAIVTATCCLQVIPAGHVGVSVTLGKVSSDACPEGLMFKKPFIESIYSFPVRQVTISDESQCVSSDLQTVDVAYAIMYRLPADRVVELYRKYTSDHENIYTNLIRPRWEEAVRQVTAKYTVENIVKQRDEIKTKALELLRTELSELVVIVDIQLTNIKLTDALAEAIEAKQVKQQEVQAKEYELQLAKKQAEIVLVNATAEADAIKVKAQALAAAVEAAGFFDYTHGKRDGD